MLGRAFWRREPVPRADGEADAATVVAATVDAAAPVAAPDDVPTPTAPTDAAVAMVVVAVDAGTARGDGARRDAGSHHVPPPSALPDASATSAVRRRVTFGASPWASFYIDGDGVEHQTPETVELAPGRHSVRFENPALHVSRTRTIDVPTDRDISHVEVMTRP